MAIQQIVWITLISVVLAVTGLPIGSSDSETEVGFGINYDEYLRQLEKKHKFIYNDIDQPWLPVHSEESQESDEFVLSIADNLSSSLAPTVQQVTSQSPVSISTITTTITPLIETEKENLPTVTDPVEELLSTIDTTESIGRVDEGSGLATTLSFDVDGRLAVSTSTESVETTTSVLEILTTIQGELSTTADDQSTDSQTDTTTIVANQLILKEDGRQTSTETVTTSKPESESRTVNKLLDGVVEKEVKQTENPDDTETTEIQSTSVTEQTTQPVEGSTLAVTGVETVDTTTGVQLSLNDDSTESVTDAVTSTDDSILVDSTVIQEIASTTESPSYSTTNLE